MVETVHGTEERVGADVDLVATSYRYVSDDAAFKDCLQAWSLRIDELGFDQNFDPAHGHTLLGGHLAGLQVLAERMAQPARESPVETVVREVNASAMVLTASHVVLTMNAKARRRFGAVQGKRNDLEWLEPDSKADFLQVIKLASVQGASGHAVVRTMDPDGNRGLAEVFVVETQDHAIPFIAVRALETEWSEQLNVTLERAFGLTPAEQDVVRMLHGANSLADIADARDNSLHTVRTHVRRILSKTGAANQVDLVRLIGLLAARTSHGRRSARDRWRDPWGNERVLIRPDGRKLAYSWTGDPKGTPVLIVHGSVQGYILGPEIEQRLQREGIKLYAISRPGFGQSDGASGGDAIQDHADAIKWLLGELRLKGGVPAIGLGNGSIPLFRLAATHDGLLSRLLVMGLLWPAESGHLSRMSATQRALAKFSRLAPRAAEIFVQISRHYIRQQGTDWYLERGWGDVPEVRDTLSNPEIIPLIRNACGLSLSGRPSDYLREMDCIWNVDPRVYKDVRCPVHHIHGEFDKSVSVAEAKAFSAISPQFSTECVPNAGYFLPYEKPRLFADRIVSIAKSG